MFDSCNEVILASSTRTLLEERYVIVLSLLVIKSEDLKQRLEGVKETKKCINHATLEIKMNLKKKEENRAEDRKGKNERREGIQML